MIANRNNHKRIFIVVLGLLITLFYSSVNSDEVSKLDDGTESVEGKIASEQHSDILSKDKALRSSLATPPKRAGLLTGVMSLLLDERGVNKPPVVTLRADPEVLHPYKNWTNMFGTVTDDGFPGTELTYEWRSIWLENIFANGGVQFKPNTHEPDNKASAEAVFATDSGLLPRGQYWIFLIVTDGEFSVQGGPVLVTLEKEDCDGVLLNPGEVCVRNCNGMDLVFGDGSLNGHSRTYANCGSAAINAGLNNMAHAVTIAEGVNCSGCH